MNLLKEPMLKQTEIKVSKNLNTSSPAPSPRIMDLIPQPLLPGDKGSKNLVINY